MSDVWDVCPHCGVCFNWYSLDISDDGKYRCDECNSVLDPPNESEPT